MTHKEELKIAKAEHKRALKNRVLYKERRDNILRAILDSEMPKWGNLRITVTPL